MHPAVPRGASTLFLGATLAATLVALVVGCSNDDDGAGGKNTPSAAQVANGGAGTVTPVPLAMPGFPVDSATINGWINNPAGPDSAQIRAHAWAIWAGLTQRTSQMVDSDSLPVYETWPNAAQVFDSVPPAAASGTAQTLVRDLHVPRQFGHSQVAQVRARRTGAREGLSLPNPGVRSDSALVMVTVSYNTAAESHIWQNGYYQQSTLDSLNKYFDTTSTPTPVANRNIVAFPNNAVALKPTYLPVAADGLTVLPYWAGPLASTDTAMPDINTWTQCVAVDPTNQRVGQTVSVKCNTQDGVQAVVVGLDQFYSFTLDTAEAVAFYQGGAGTMQVNRDTWRGTDSVTAGDYGVLVAMHVTTKEISNWTWQTFWWTPNWQQNPLANDQPATVTGAFQNYAMKTAYYMTVPNGPAQGQNEVTFNPYLEPDLAPQGKLSNCMTCHRAAIWNTNQPYSKFFGNLSPSDPYFNGVTKVDFLWSIPGNAVASTQ
ncbi:MAG TPA: hypothetical protein VHG91_18635 [Longimicrobium sp.]|nr:hypothetical protein [Longimicrobium sp.]